MAHVIRMPGISADSEEAVLLEWNIGQGASISFGDNLATVETEKANVDIEADGDGTLWRTLVEPGTTVPVGNPIAVILEAGESADDEAGILASLGLGAAPAAPATPAATAAPEPAPVPAPAPTPEPAPVPAAAAASAPASAPISAPSGGRLFSSPLARKIARDAGLELDSIVGTGPSGRIIRADVERAIADVARASAPSTPSAAPAPPAASTAATDAGAFDEVPHTKLRRAIAGALQASKQEAPHFYLTKTARVDELLALRERVNAGREARISINDFVVKAVAVALREFPDVRVTWGADAVRRHHTVDVAVAVSTERGLVTPVIRNADAASVSAISAQVRDFVERARDGRLKQSELEGGTFTVTNLGMYGVEEFSAIINPPHAGILAVGAVVKRPVVGDDDVIEVGHTLTVTVSADHRPVDGVIVAQWLQRFTQLLENPLEILT
ncbi:dihydrolipoamide acetyltransferase family protein [Microcella sp.]|uniref:dihydrolipoamide acetyltransferase family protein n=1 Tax=Microcella sp. TaxID=1913979 RepID=UPI003918BB8B